MTRMAEGVTKYDLIKRLGLRPHLTEGGYYSEIYRSEEMVADGRAAMDTIYYMLTDDSPIGHFHKNQSDIVHFYHLGNALRYTTISPAGQVDSFILGPGVDQGEQLQCVVPAGYWKASRLITGSFGLISEAVVPAFNEKTRTLASRAMLGRAFPDISDELLSLAWP